MAKEVAGISMTSLTPAVLHDLIVSEGADTASIERHSPAGRGLHASARRVFRWP